MVKIKDAGLQFGSLTPLNKNNLKYIVHHHMAHETWDINDVHNYHKNSNGWSGIGYNFWIAFDGTVYQGRGFNVGAHCLNYNSVSIGVGYQGHFNKQEMTDAQVESGIALVKYLNDWASKTLDNVGHGDLVATACPGKNFRMDEIKGGIGVKVVEQKPTQTKSETATKTENTSVNLTVDGKWGNDTTRGLQTVLGTPVDGIISDQLSNAVTRAFYGNTIDFGNGRNGSLVVKSLQRKIGATVDGLLGPQTIRLLQAYLGTVQDGVLSRPSLVVRALQERVNTGKF